MDLIKHGSSSLGFRGAMGRTHKSKIRGTSRGDFGQVYLRNDSGRKCLRFYTKKGGAYNKRAGDITISFQRRAAGAGGIGDAWWLCKVYDGATNKGGSISSGAGKTLAQFVATFNAVTGDSVNSNLVCQLVGREVNEAFHAGVAKTDGVQLKGN